MDILNRLSGYNPPDRVNDEMRQIAVDIHDAKKEIARLRDYLKMISWSHRKPSSHGNYSIEGHKECVDFARAALGETE